MKKDIKRNDFKYNFLKKIIIRIDYTGILELELEQTIMELKRFLHGAGFVNFKESYINEVEFDLKDPEQIETQLALPISELRKNKAFNFATKDMSQTLKVTKFFTTLSIESDRYVSFETFGNIFSKVIEIINNNNEFIRILRLGLRKINNCILLDISKLNEYFEEKYFDNIANGLDADEIEINMLRSEKTDSFYVDDKNVNLTRFLLLGLLDRDGEEKDAYQVILDIDVYENDEELLERITKDYKNVYNKLTSINDLSFKLYIQMLKDEFISQLKANGVDEDIILGVEKND